MGDPVGLAFEEHCKHQLEVQTDVPGDVGDRVVEGPACATVDAKDGTGNHHRAAAAVVVEVEVLPGDVRMVQRDVVAGAVVDAVAAAVAQGVADDHVAHLASSGVP